MHWILDLAEAQLVLTPWQEHDDNHRPHTRLQAQCPVRMHAGGARSTHGLEKTGLKIHGGT